MRVLKVGRAAFFGSAREDLPRGETASGRAAIVANDDLVPQFGYVGKEYVRTRVLLIGINPGNSKDDSRSRQDEAMMPAQHAFAKGPSPEIFRKAQQAYKEVCWTWPVWKRHCSEVIGSGKLSLEDVAYSNVLPWRTNSKSQFGESVAERAASLYAYPLVEELEPQVIIAMGKRAAEVLSVGGRTFANLIVWNRAQAATSPVLGARRSAAAQVFDMLGRRHG